MSSPSITMFVFNDCTHDARVLKEARTLTDAGFRVQIIAKKTAYTKFQEEREGFVIKRIGLQSQLFATLFNFNLAQHLFSIKKKSISISISIARQLIIKLLTFIGMRYRKIQMRFETQNLNPELIFLSKLTFVPVFLLYRAIIFFNRATRFSLRYTKRFIKKLLRIVNRFSLPLLMGKVFHFNINAYQFVKQNPTNIYHAHDLNTLLAGWLAKKKFGGKLVYDSHELYVDRNAIPKPSPLTKKLTTIFEKFLLKNVDESITVNQSIAEILRDRYNIKIPHVIMNTPTYNVIKTPRSLRLELAIPSNKRIIVYSGSITFNRGLEEQISALKYLSDCALVLMGYGKKEYLETLHEHAQEKKVESQLYFFGPVSHQEVSTYLASADVGTAPIKNAALSYYLCSPNKLFEYVQAGIPVVGSNFPELSRVIHHHKIGYTFNPDDPQDIARAIKKVFAELKYYRQMQANARAAAKIYNWERESEKLLNVYRELGFEVRSMINETETNKNQLTTVKQPSTVNF